MIPGIRRFLAGALLLAAGALPAPAGPQEPPPPAVPRPPGEKVVVWHRTIAELREARPSFTLKERAEDAARRIAGVSFEDLDKPVVRTAATLEGRKGILLSVAGRNLLLLGAEDAPEGETLEAHAEEVAGRIAEVFAARIEQENAPALLRGIGSALLSALAAAGVLWILVRLRRAVEGRLGAMAARRRLAVAGVDTAPAITGFTHLVLQILLAAGVSVVLYIWVAFGLSRFPYTAPLSRELGSFLLGALSQVGEAILEAVPGLFMAAVIFLIARLADRASSGFFRAIIEGRVRVSWLDPEPARATRRIASVLIWILALVLAYPHLPGSGTDAFKGMSLLVGLMVSLGSAGFVNQVLSGFVIVYSRALQPGDWVRVGETEGAVRLVGLLSTKVLTPLREEVTIPNALLVGNRVVNYTRLAAEEGAVVAVTVTIGYDAPWRQVHGLLLGAAGRIPLLRKDPAPVVFQRALSDFYTEYELRVHHDCAGDRAPMLSDLHAAIQDAFNEAGVQIMSPHFMVQPDGRVVVPKRDWNGIAPPPAQG